MRLVPRTRRVLPVALLTAAVCLPSGTAQANPVALGSCTLVSTGADQVPAVCLYTGNLGYYRLSLTVTSTATISPQTWRATLRCAPGGPTGVSVQVTRESPGTTTKSTGSLYRTGTSLCLLVLEQVNGNSLSRASAFAN